MADTFVTEWKELHTEFEKLEGDHKDYCQKVDDVKSIQKKCMAAIAHQRYRLRQIVDGMTRLEKSCSPEEKESLKEIKEKIDHRKIEFRELEENLPHENGIYLKVILGSVNVSLLSKQDKFKYKENYESFKLYITIISIVLASIMCIISYRVTDAAFQFLLVWYYCTLTIREHILIVNGSRIKGWWISHHFISTVCAGILLIWPESYSYQEFRTQFVVFSVFISLLQLMQYYYQKASLYRLRALGERHNMDLTVEGFQSWMWRGLGFLLPFLVMGYMFQLYNAYILYQLSQNEQCKEWQVTALAMIFLLLGLGNTYTMWMVVRQKIKKRWSEFVLKNKYRFSNKVHQT